MDREQLEFRISQYVDGTLPAAEAAALEETLASDAEARALLDDFRKLHSAMAREAALPAVKWDRLAEHLSRAVAEEDRATRSIPMPTPAAAPAHTWWRHVAVAAAVLIAIGTLVLWPRRTGHDQIASRPTQPTVLVELAGPQVSKQPAVVEISMASSAAPAQQAGYRIAEDIIYRPPRVVIASSDGDRQDTGQRLPY